MAGSSSYKLDPGPLELSVLTQQLTHRSRDIWDGSVDMILNARKSDGSFWKLVEKYPIHPRVLEVIKLSGLYGVYRCNRSAIDRSLITSLVERWRPETHTFHFRTGETTITLQDIEVLYGLPVNGAPVLGIETTRTIGDCNSFLKVSALKEHMLSEPQLSDMATQEIVNQKARCYMFWMIAGTMMADTSGSYLKLIYLPILEDVNAIGSYSWGSATLAYLYRFLCKASQSIQNEIAGFLPLLQVWAWERITVLRPQIVGKRGTKDIFPTDLRRGPHATRWFAHFSWTNTTKYVLKVYRDALDSMTEDQFIWEPYSDDLIESLPDYCRAGRDMWRVRVPIFCWDVVEVHLPDRVMRQFGLQQINHGPLRRDLYMFKKIVLDQSSDCLRYVHEDDRIHVSTDYRRDEVQPDQLRPPIRRREKDGVARRRERVIARDQVLVEMNEMDEAMQNAQISSEDDQATTNHDFGSTSMGCTQEFTQASGMIYQHTEIVPYMTLQTPQTPQISRT
ncbi:protein MAIN-LIKE 2-like [Capsicum annuum]